MSFWLECAGAAPAYVSVAEYNLLRGFEATAGQGADVYIHSIHGVVICSTNNTSYTLIKLEAGGKYSKGLGKQHKLFLCSLWMDNN